MWSIISRASRSQRLPKRQSRIYFVSNLPAFPLWSQGILSSKVLPSESDLRSRNWPPWFSITEYEMASPNPIPQDFVVKNGSNMAPDLRQESQVRNLGPTEVSTHHRNQL